MARTSAIAFAGIQISWKEADATREPEQYVGNPSYTRQNPRCHNQRRLFRAALFQRLP